MKTSRKIINRTTEVNSNKSVYAVYGMDSEGLNFKHETSEFNNFKEALESFNKIELEEGDQKILRMQIVNESDIVLFEDYLIEESK